MASGPVADAERRLHEAKEARDAAVIAGASPSEIARLDAEVSAAHSDYLSALADAAQPTEEPAMADDTPGLGDLVFLPDDGDGTTTTTGPSDLPPLPDLGDLLGTTPGNGRPLDNLPIPFPGDLPVPSSGTAEEVIARIVAQVVAQQTRELRDYVLQEATRRLNTLGVGNTASGTITYPPGAGGTPGVTDGTSCGAATQSACGSLVSKLPKAYQEAYDALRCDEESRQNGLGGIGAWGLTTESSRQAYMFGKLLRRFPTLPPLDCK